MKLNCCGQLKPDSEKKQTIKDEPSKHQYEEFIQIYSFKEQYDQQKQHPIEKISAPNQESKSIIRVPIEQFQKQDNEQIIQTQNTTSLFEVNSMEQLPEKYINCFQCQQNICSGFITLPCLHQYCFQCLKKVITEQLQNGKSLLQCLCGKRLKTQILDQFFQNQQFDIIKEQLFTYQLNEIIKNLTQKWKCQNCDFFCILRQPKQDQLYCPTCLRYYIQSPSKIVKTSGVKQQIQAQNRLNGSQISNTMQTKYLKCYQCGLDICSGFITLPCLHQYCFQCLKKVITEQLQNGKSLLQCLCGKRLKTQILDQLCQNQQFDIIKEQLFTYQLNEIIKNLTQKWKCQNCDFFCILRQPKQDQLYCPTCLRYYIQSPSKIVKTSGVKQQIQAQNRLNGSQISNTMQTKYLKCYQCGLDICRDFITLPCLHQYCFQCLKKIITEQLQNGKSLLQCLCGKRLKTQILDQFCQNQQFDIIKEQLFTYQLNEIIKNQAQKWKCQNCDFFCILRQPKQDQLYCPTCLVYYIY